ncbi:MAG: hypothetical protein HWN65_16110 [Candidatus Helarchaeota archaeon]|nr:hypothetical protein [Candidatus Helarchaeota archaeon]
MYIVLTSTYPFSKNVEAQKAFMQALKTNPIPSYITQAVPLAVRAGRAGVETLAVFEVKSDKIQDAITEITKFLRAYWGIEGYTYEAKLWATGEEAFEMIGEKMPEM